MITRSPRTSSKVLILITATLWIARVVELSRALTLRIIFPCWWTQVCRRPSASLDDSQRRLAERAGCILLPIHTHTIWLLAWLGVVSVTPLIEISRPKTRPLSPPRILPQLFRVFVFWGGGGTPPREIYSVLHSQPKFRWRSSRAREEGGGVYSFFRSRSRRGGPFKRTNRGQENRNGGIGNRGPINREHERARFSTNILLDQRHRHSLSASDEALCIL